LTRTDARGVVTNYSPSGYAIDALNRVQRKTYSDATPAVTYTYDTATNGVGRLSSVGNSVSTTNYTAYDGLGRVTAGNQNTSGGATYPFSYVYNALGLKSMTYPSGRIVTYHYDGAGRLDKAGLNTEGATDYVSSVSYHPHGAPNVTTLGNAVVETALYNSRLQPRLLEAAKTTSLWKQENFFCPSEQLDCTSNNGNVVSQKLTAGGTLALATAYGYDGVNRITSAGETGARTPWSQNYIYTTDGSNGRFGNLSQTGDGLPSGLNCSSYDSTNNRCNASGFGYDTAGNLTAFGGRSILYDAESRQKTLLDGSTTWTYSYDGEGRRVKKTDGVATTVYVYDAFGKLAAEYASAAPADQPDCVTCYLTLDHLGSTRLVTDGVTGQVKRRTDYHPFGWEVNPGYGDRNSVAGYSTTDKFNPKFTGKLRDYESGLGLDYFGARYYSAAQGRFTSPDEFTGGIVDAYSGGQVQQLGPLPYADITDPQTLNKYAYVRNNPLRFVDPDGHCGPWCSGLIGGAIGGLVGGGVEIGRELYAAYRSGDAVQLDGQKIFAKAANGAIFGATVGATGGLSLLETAGAYTAASIVGGAVERGADGDSRTRVLDKKAVAADVVTGFATGMIGGASKELAKGMIAAGSKQATSRTGSLLEQAIQSGDVAKIAKREAQAQAVQNSINGQAVGAAVLQRTATKTAVGAVLKPKEEQ
jgi:RHS repeat-associated protein